MLGATAQRCAALPAATKPLPLAFQLTPARRHLHQLSTRAAAAEVPVPSKAPANTTGTYNTAEQDAAAPSPLTASARRVTPQQQQLNRERPLVKPEILAPAGGWPQVKAACENGADAVYFGTPDFNARARASNFEAEELHDLMKYLHARGVNGYVALNILVFDEELEALESRIREVAEAGVDALIVQDLGAVELVRRVAPGLPIHGSTQMSITSGQGAEFAAGLGVERVVVGRELSIKEIAKVRDQSTTEVEAFVHGALCVSYSGQCFSSEAWGGRSANRGQCAQACRMPYGLIVDGMLKDLQDVSYLLSPQDLMAVSHVPELIMAGVGCFKIEGRLKGPEYVALTTQVYRRAVDAAWAALTAEAAGGTAADSSSDAAPDQGAHPDPSSASNTAVSSSSSSNASNATSTSTSSSAADSSSSSSSAGVRVGGSPAVPEDTFVKAKASVALSRQEQWDLEQVFARGQDANYNGLTPGFLDGPVHQRLVRGRGPRHRGVFAGSVVKVVRSSSSSSSSAFTQQQQRQQQQRARSHEGSSSSGRGSDARGVGAQRGGNASHMKRGNVGERKAGAQKGRGSRGSSTYSTQSVGSGASSRNLKTQGVEKSSGVAVVLELACPLKRGDGLVFDAGQAEQLEEGGAVYDLLDQQGRSITGSVTPPAAIGGSMSQTQRDSAAPNSAPTKGDPPTEPLPTQLVTVVFGGGQVDASRIQEGQLVWRTKDAGLESRLRASYEGLAAADLRRQPVRASVSGALGMPLSLTLRDAAGHEVCAHTSTTLEPASNRHISKEDVVRALGVTLGGAADNTLALEATDFSGLQLEQGLFMPASELKALRRAGTDALVAAQEASHAALKGRVAPTQQVLAGMLADISSRQPHVSHPAQNPASPAPASAAGPQDCTTSQSSGAVAPPISNDNNDAAPRKGGGTRRQGAGKEAAVSLLCRTPEQVDACLSVPWLQEVVLDFLEVQGLWEAVAAVKNAGKRVIVATPRILKPNEEPLVAFYLRLRADALLLRSAGLLHTLTGLGGPGSLVPGLRDPKGNPVHVPELHGDFSLNVANTLSADLLLRHSSLARVTPTHDMSAPQICTLAATLGQQRAASSLEVILHQHLPIFHTEHCVFCRFLSAGNSYKDCGHPCEKHRVHLRDDKGADHLVLADMGCRNTVFNAQAQSGAFYAHNLVHAGVRKFRIELVDEPSEVVAPLLQGYRDLLDSNRTPGDLWSWMGSLSEAGVGAGSLEGARARDREASALRSTAATRKEEARRQAGQAAKKQAVAA